MAQGLRQLRQYVPDTGPRVRVNQVGYLPCGPKHATVVTDAPGPIPWRMNNSAGATVASGTSTPAGMDPSSGQRVHTLDFGAVAETGTGYTLSADGQTSYPFDISATLYDQLRSDALHFFYVQRSGIPITEALAPGYGRPAGHLGIAPNQGDTSVPCLPGVGDYALDVRGGWYDAGDTGKYVVGGGIATYQLLSQYERTLTAPPGRLGPPGDGELRIPEAGDGVPDILDEARWELEFLLRMQVPAGQPRAGMAHHKVHDDNWTGLPLSPDQDPQPRHLHPPSTAATLNLAAVAAQGARLYAPHDHGFARRCLTAARTAWVAAQAHREVFADAADTIGGGPYDDTDVTDEFFWAAAELFLTTGEQAFLDALRASPYATGEAFPPSGFGWQQVAALGRLDLATVLSPLPDADRLAARASVVAAADRYLDTAHGQAYGMPLGAGDYVQGSNSVLLNKLVVIATAFDLTGDRRYRDGVLEGLDYIFGRNALNQSYVTGYGEHHSHNQHSRLYGHQIDPALPGPPAGSLAGGPSAGLEDPKANRLLIDRTVEPPRRPAPQLCYLDDIQSWSTNEVAVNWNAALSWVVSFAADQPAAAEHGRGAIR
ncbi:glycoside hydrolase family 9 protein [Streptomyces sp. NBS 14/10]|uniref:glycoside hydrolase family 9 protein n=1 Tax=Streptomyces sp. NBS 14/10 TaxID=1945643 RepID=UPI000B7CF349|nr:glycoside hydrolase family 9 protein [Streptomyces sp. NBS 14/10]KAK1177395.1 glycoside hydrolase family 9 protein [Streptomyces sp. NBS 14/10]